MLIALSEVSELGNLPIYSITMPAPSNKPPWLCRAKRVYPLLLLRFHTFTPVSSQRVLYNICLLQRAYRCIELSDLDHRMRSSPLLRRRDSSWLIFFPSFRNVGGKRVIGVWCAEESLNREEDCPYLKSWRPVALPN